MLPEAEARHERTLEAVSSIPLLDCSSPDFERDTRGPAPWDAPNGTNAYGRHTTANRACRFNGDRENLVLGLKRPSLYRYDLLALKLLELIIS